MRLLIVDMNALLSRAYYVKRNWYWYTMLINRARLFDTTHIIFCFDEPSPPEDNVRKALNSEYKANRKPDKERYVFIEEVKLLVKEHLPESVYSHYEADDQIASIAYSFNKLPECEAIGIMTGDKDLFQCSQLGKVNILYLHDKENFIYNKDMVTMKYMQPEHIATYKALAGDTGDNIKGGRKIGDKTARKLITEFGTLENMYANIDLIDNKVANKLEASIESIFESRTLATLRFVEGLYFAEPYDESKLLMMRQKAFNKMSASELERVDWELL